MNCPAKTEPIVGDGYNQNPNALCSSLTTRSDLGLIANARLRREHRLIDPQDPSDLGIIARSSVEETEGRRLATGPNDGTRSTGEDEKASGSVRERYEGSESSQEEGGTPTGQKVLRKTLGVLKTYCKFVGPGFMISVAYIDPGNYATDVAAGASYRFKLLFVVLLANIFAIFLQSLCINLGTVTGRNLAQMIRLHCPPWLNYTLWLFGESAIIATDMAEVIGTAIALSLLSDGKIPLVAGCAISIADVLFILIFYRPNGASITARRVFEFFVALLVLGVLICFSIQLSFIKDTSVGEVFHGYVPSSTLVQGKALYQACGILGATVMPHSLYLGSGLVQDRLKDFDTTHNLLPRQSSLSSDDDDASDTAKHEIYRPSLRAIHSCKGYATAECAISLATFALFVNSAILIVAGSALYGLPGAATTGLFGIYTLLNTSLAPATGTLFAVALLLSGLSAGIVCTLAGQIVCEGQLLLRMKPWKQRLLTRSISIAPSIIVAGALGSEGVDKALVGSQVALSVILPVVSAPLVWFTCFGKYMTVTVDADDEDGAGLQRDGERREGEGARSINMRAHPVTAFFAVCVWAMLVIMNVALLVLLGLGRT